MVEITKKSGGPGKALGCMALIGVGVLGLGALGSQLDDSFQDAGPATAGASPDGAALAAGESASPDGPATAWTYNERKDELRGSTDHFADITSDNEVQFDFPYAGGSSLTMTVRQSKAYGSDVIFQISDGQFVCGLYDCAGMISFDGAAEKLSLVTPEDHDSKTLFAQYDEAIIRKLKSADKVIVELPFYQEGNRQFTFRTAGLKWDH